LSKGRECKAQVIDCSAREGQIENLAFFVLGWPIS